MAYDGNGDCVTISSNTENIKTDLLTVMCWVYQVDPPVEQYNYPVNKWDYVSAAQSWGFYFDTGDDKMKFVGYTGAATTSVDVDYSSYVNKWTFLVGVYDGTDMILYFNAVEVDRGALASMMSTAMPIVLGADAGLSGTWFTGSVDEVAIYNRVVSEAEIVDKYQRNPRAQ